MIFFFREIDLMEKMIFFREIDFMEKNLLYSLLWLYCIRRGLVGSIIPSSGLLPFPISAADSRCGGVDIVIKSALSFLSIT